MEIEEIESKIDMINPFVGQRIYVFSNNYVNLGLGTIVNVDVLESDSGDIITDKYVTVKLDNGRLVEQLNCIWYPIDVGE